MKREILNILPVLLIVFFLTSCCCKSPAQVSFDDMEVNKKPSDYDSGMTYDKALKEGKPIVIKFYADWCGACRRAAPVFDTVRSSMSAKASFVMVNADNNPELAEVFAIRHYPTLFIVNPANEEKEEIPNNYVYDEESLKTYLEQNLDKFIPDKKVFLY